LALTPSITLDQEVPRLKECAMPVIDPTTSGEHQAGALLGRDPASVRKRVEAMENMLEGLFVIPGTRFRVGLDALMGLLPVGGSVIAAAMGSWMAWEARNLGMPRLYFFRMAGNIALDALLGAVPVVGLVPDVFFRSNTRNLKIIRSWLDKNHPHTVTVDV